MSSDTTTADGRSPKRALAAKALLMCGALSSLLYVASDLFASATYPGYVYRDQAFSELLAIGSPTRPFMMASANVYNVLVIAFGIGVLLVAGRKRMLRAAGVALLVYGVVSGLGPYVPMTGRGGEFALTDALHIADTVGMILAMFAFIVFGGLGLGKRFRLFSAATLLAIIGGAALAFAYIPAIASGSITPWVGIVERVNIYSMLLWVAVFAIALLASGRADAQPAVEPERHPLPGEAAGAR